MQFDMDKITAPQRYKLLTGLIVPRPIALVTTLNAAGHINAAPFSFFNAMGADPALVVLGVGNRSAREPKDTANNIRSQGEFVVNLVDESIAEAMNITACDFPAGVNELEQAGLTHLASSKVRPPRIAESPVSMECREVSTTEIGRNRIILGQVLFMHVRDDLVDPNTFHVHTEKMHAVGRMHAPGWYARTTDLFEMQRPIYTGGKQAIASR